MYTVVQWIERWRILCLIRDEYKALSWRHAHKTIVAHVIKCLLVTVVPVAYSVVGYSVTLTYVTRLRLLLGLDMRFVLPVLVM